MITIHINANLHLVVKERVGMLYWMMDPEVIYFANSHTMLNPSHSKSAFLFFPCRGKIQYTSSKYHFNSVRLSRVSEQAGYQ
ncbi:hypothetical protein BO85DRAFT_258741 [Aspergillus piperis CBS 112811]|uniref:Uncharacterized protein n=1 Tax=Aspergillus piperis CBS 112811 TaxID=1448313 RepID=A0A8G1R8Y6_9EURO|nr:hypothetical protein BO85DRAFT_258741 [Aspergillus piperis CBS 112811]RAH58945.1 hypothetical protein BO85DRAFT_258741 [Aspergillus piperis CBS 112811]